MVAVMPPDVCVVCAAGEGRGSVVPTAEGVVFSGPLPTIDWLAQPERITSTVQRLTTMIHAAPRLVTLT
jgi:hypothetical protein